MGRVLISGAAGFESGPGATTDVTPVAAAPADNAMALPVRPIPWRGGSVTSRIATGVAAVVAAANANRKAITFKNVAAEIVYIAETNAKATAALGFRLKQDESVRFEHSTNAWSAFSALAGDLAIIEES